MEVFEAVRDLKRVRQMLNLIAHLIVVGMFSEEQFEVWIGKALLISRSDTRARIVDLASKEVKVSL